MLFNRLLTALALNKQPKKKIENLKIKDEWDKLLIEVKITFF